MEEGDQSRYFVRAEVAAESRHVSVALEDLTNQLVVGQSSGYATEVRSPLATRSVDGVAIPALFSLDHGGADMLKRRSAHDEFRLDGDSAPRVHMR